MHLVTYTAHEADDELVAASGEVIAKRVAMGVAGMADPAGADRAELARMLPEQADAISDCAIAMIDRSGHMAEHMVRLAAAELLLASRACVALAGCRSPEAWLAAQQGLALAWTAQILSKATVLGASAMLAQGAAMAPFRGATAVNAGRPGPYPGLSLVEPTREGRRGVAAARGSAGGIAADPG
jgi:hypothetical protein